jgi:hypothetical protein
VGTQWSLDPDSVQNCAILNSRRQLLNGHESLSRSILAADLLMLKWYAVSSATVASANQVHWNGSENADPRLILRGMRFWSVQ